MLDNMKLASADLMHTWVLRQRMCMEAGVVWWCSFAAAHALCCNGPVVTYNRKQPLVTLPGDQQQAAVLQQRIPCSGCSMLGAV
jgi:shikimate kinase